MNYTTDDYNSGDGMLTYIWGPPLWHFLHTISFNYPVNPSEEDKDNYYNFLMSMGRILPCRYCRENFTKNLKSIKLNEDDFETRENFSKMIYDLHNEVNKVLNKKYNISFEEVQWKYEHFRSRCNLQDLRKINEKEKEKKKVKKEKVKEKGCIEPMNGVPKHKCKLVFEPLTIKNEKKDSICFNRCSFNNM